VQPPSHKIFKNHAIWCIIFTCFKMHPVNRGGAAAPPTPFLESATVIRTALKLFNKLSLVAWIRQSKA